jgi:hypothetical protein
VPGTIHENVKTALLKTLRDVLNSCKQDPSLAEPEWRIHYKGETNLIDIAFRNLKLVCEVEPSTSDKTIGFRQLKNYARKAIHMTRQNKVFGILAWGLDSRGEIWDCEVYEFSLDTDGNLNSNLLGSKSEIESVVPVAARGFIPLTAENFLSIFFPIKEHSKKLSEIFKNHLDDERVKTLYEVYSNALQMIYGKGDLSTEKIKELFIIHTIIQMIAVAVLNRIRETVFRPGELEILTGSGRDFSISLPFLEWWYKLNLFGKLQNEEVEFFKKLSREIGNKVLAFNWEEKTRDIFRLLYEAFITEEDRRQFGEYYTPPWLVNFTLEKLGSLKDKLIIDPFCGSGTFLDYAFRRKVEEGEEPDKAYRELLGFDINPLAVFLARAELSLSYFYLTSRFPSVPPQIFYVNSLEAVNKYSIGKLWISEKEDVEPLFLYKINELTNAINVSKLLSKKRGLSLSKFMEFENTLSYLLRKLEQELYINRSKAEQFYDHFLSRLQSRKPELATYFHALDKESILNLIGRYGDGVWSIAITSLYAIGLLFLQKENREIYVVSNPPWIPLTEIKGRYGEAIRKKAKQYFPSIPPQSRLAGDIASLFLRAWTDYGQKIAFVVSSKVAYDNSLHGIGKLLTYEAVKNNCTIYFINYDVFKHGIPPAVVIYGTGENLACRIKPLTSGISKDAEEAPLEKHKCENYTEYIEALKMYFNLDTEELADWLGAVRVYKMGTYIRGLFGGEKKKGKESYAGLILKNVNCDLFPCRIRLWNTESFVELEDENLIKRLIYVGKIYPFWTGTYDCLLSDKGEEDLRRILHEFLMQNIRPSDKKRIKVLINEFKQSPLIKLKKNRWYVISRADRTFAAVTLKGSGKEIPESHVSLLEIDSEEKAFYYSGVLNYLVLKVQKGFIRHQFARPFLAIAVANLEWQNLQWQYDIANTSKELHHSINSKNLFGNLPKGFPVQRAIKIMFEDEEIADRFLTIVDILDSNVDPENLERALSLVRKT